MGVDRCCVGAECGGEGDDLGAGGESWSGDGASRRSHGRTRERRTLVEPKWGATAFVTSVRDLPAPAAALAVRGEWRGAKGESIGA